MAANADKAWFTGAQEGGIGAPSTLPVAAALGEGKTPGEGFVNSIGMTFRWCPPGKFTMGSEQTDNAATRDRAPVEVTLSQGFWMGEHEVTQREYYAIMRKTLPSTFTLHKNAPWWGMTEAKAVTDFCKKLAEIDRKADVLPSGWEYACPTEAEWEYACRAGSNARFCFGDSVSELGQYGNFADRTLHNVNPDFYWAEQSSADGVAEALAFVGSYRPNAWGIRDMHGNVAELVADHLSLELPGGTDPLVQLEKDGQTQIRGGAWCSQPLYCESSFRNALSGRDKQNHIGFRIVLKKSK
jgi:formylglycine-generating enzyme required for sulfatase activity